MTNRLFNAQQISLIAIYFVFLSTFLTVSIQKLRSGVPDWFLKQFENTFISKMPGGASLGFYVITALETLVAILFIISIFRLEIAYENPKTFLKLALSFAMLTFGFLGFGLRIANDFQGAANLFAYFGTTTAVLIYISFISPT